MRPLGQDWRFYRRDLMEALDHLREALRGIAQVQRQERRAGPHGRDERHHHVDRPGHGERDDRPRGEGRGDRGEGRGPRRERNDDDGPAPEFAPAFLTRDDD